MAAAARAAAARAAAARVAAARVAVASSASDAVQGVYVACTACVAEEPPRLRALGGGVFEVTMRLLLLGEATLRSSLSDSRDVATEVRFRVAAGAAWPSQCSLRVPDSVQTHRPSELQVELRDQLGHRCESLCPLEVRLAPRGHSHGRRGTTHPPVFHADQGRAAVAFVLDSSGAYDVSVTVAGAHVFGSPFVLHARPAAIELARQRSGGVRGLESLAMLDICAPTARGAPRAAAIGGRRSRPLSAGGAARPVRRVYN